jgi:hypothetical protein
MKPMEISSIFCYHFLLPAKAADARFAAWADAAGGDGGAACGAAML